ncbi:hypothetical protein PpBr36_01233 [Pyricularia pennisetigena]|uniref:hypothetical protein n=1 Tax=Pyricularia pennisetigena TaxID=1578925 RepID=UPI00115296A6|nr:hypothetical protein PpBr36_01233 [Pyricularia pennisetigena]TLS28848.1 hypothetical protein PpBr36_01233 [Pyricularia pennisetigena]
MMSTVASVAATEKAAVRRPDVPDWEAAAASDAVSEEKPANPRKRKKSSRACDFCHVNHQPCDNAKPRCGYCEKHGKQCLYLRPQKKRGPAQGYRNALHSMRESAAAWGVALSLIPELDTMVEAAIAQSEQDGQAVSVSVKDPDQQDALIASWQQSRAFRAFFGDEAAASATAGVAASEKEEGSPKVNEGLATSRGTHSDRAQPPAPVAGPDWTPAKTASPPSKHSSFLTSPPLHDGSLTGIQNMFDSMDHSLGLPFSVSDLVVHQIQSGQVIVDLCSVAKELVENSLDAGATAIDVRFKNQGLDSIEVQDNGYGIAPQNYAGVALKHHTSKLSSFADLDTLHTFGFRGEALSSLCALSHFTVTTCLQSDVPRGTKLEFEVSGKLKSTSLVAAQKGTVVTVETLFHNLPVRRRELERNIKREWGKVINLLNQYACIQTGIKFTVSQQTNKGKRTVLFSTKGNKSTRENIVNVFGAKTLSALITLDLELELEPTTSKATAAATGSARQQGETTTVFVRGHVSRPVRGEGRQTPDRQMFYVNGRPCILPQFAKVFNEVYKIYNSTQSPFIFADIQLDTHLYDVNVSPDKRSILLHDQGRMLDNMREALIELFEKQDITIPVSQLTAQKLTTPFKMPTIPRRTKDTPTSGQQHKDVQEVGDNDDEDDVMADTPDHAYSRQNSGPVISDKSPARVSTRVTDFISARAHHNSDARPEQPVGAAPPKRKESVPDGVATFLSNLRGDYTYNDESAPSEPEVEETKNVEQDDAGAGSRTLNAIETGEDGSQDHVQESPVRAIAPPRSQGIKASQAPAFSTLKRPSTEVATITIGDQTVTSVVGGSHKRRCTSQMPQTSQGSKQRSGIGKGKAPLPSFNGRLTQMFAASSARGSEPDPGTLLMDDASLEVYEEIDDSDAMSEAPLDHSQVEEDESNDDARERSIVGSSQDKEHQITQKDSSPSLAEEDGDGAPNSEQNEEAPNSPGMFVDSVDDDENYIEEEEKKRQEEEKVQKLISEAEKTDNEPRNDVEKRSKAFLKGRARRKDSTLTLVQTLRLPDRSVHRQENMWRASLERMTKPNDISRAGYHNDEDPALRADAEGVDADTENAEAKLSLTITKSDFEQMKIIGQFNLGFIIAVREAATKNGSDVEPSGRIGGELMDDELFIIDQHASDEKYNFERLQASTVVESQRLVRPKPLELTALEEEIIIENREALETNGFMVEVDESGESPVGSRCRLLSLPLSRETTFSLADLEELVSLLADNPTTTATTVPRPSRVRKMFAMRACRSSIMVGRALSRPQMEKVVRHMGGMEKPWNCPHGRPTMRHLCGLGTTWDGRLWEEGDGFDNDVDDQDSVDFSVYT